jgi:hypothetical protein
MSTQSVPATSADKQARTFLGFIYLNTKPGDLVVFHHSSLFYWWPVWLLGLILAGITAVDGYRMALVPEGTRAVDKQKVLIKSEDGSATEEERYILILPKDTKQHLQAKMVGGGKETYQPYIMVSHLKGLGTLFVAVLLLVIVITNFPMRGLLSVLVIVSLIMLSIIFAVAGWWEPILSHVRLLAIHINFSGYLVLSLVLLATWIISFFIVDRQTYLIFTPGQVRARLDVGGGETVFDTMGMVVQKQRGDLFRHWILGFGSGDLVVRPAGAQHPIELPNVMNVGSVVKRIERMVKEKVVVER